MFCTHCGTEARSEDRFCRSCGRELNQIAGMARPTEPIPEGGQPGPTWSGRPAAPAPAATAAGRVPHPSARFVPGGTGEIAQTGQRIGAFAIDLALMLVGWIGVAFAIGIVYIIANGIPEDGRVPASDEETIGLLVWAIACPLIFVGTWVLNASGGSAGKRMVGLRIVRADGSAPGIGWGLGRTLTAWLSWAAFGLGFLWGTWDDHAQTWHDKMAGTYVVRADSLVVPPSVETRGASLH